MEQKKIKNAWKEQNNYISLSTYCKHTYIHYLQRTVSEISEIFLKQIRCQNSAYVILIKKVSKEINTVITPL